ncbi:hypothetical protein [Acinetobacter bereziniae]|nr:hypothetical protein [Acinetobacter bereziniae]
MNNNLTAQNSLDEICYQRLTAPDFAQKQSFKIRLINWVKGGAK